MDRARLGNDRFEERLNEVIGSCQKDRVLAVEIDISILDVCHYYVEIVDGASMVICSASRC